MPRANEDYVSYLVQFRSVQRNNERIWIASIRCTATGAQRTFPSVPALLQFLHNEFCESKQSGEVGPRGVDGGDLGQEVTRS